MNTFTLSGSTLRVGNSLQDCSKPRVGETHNIFQMPSLCARHCFSSGKTIMNRTRKSPSLMKLTFLLGRLTKTMKKCKVMSYSGKCEEKEKIRPCAGEWQSFGEGGEGVFIQSTQGSQLLGRRYLSCHLSTKERALHRYGEAAGTLSARSLEWKGVWCAQRTEIRLESLWHNGRGSG